MRQLKEKASVTLRTSKQWSELELVDPSLPSTRFRKLQVTMLRGQIALYIQLRTGHAPLAKHLYRLKTIDSPGCKACKNAHETVKHYLLDCPATERYRAGLVKALGRESRSIRTLLSHPDALKPLMEYIGKTGRFGDTYRALET